MFYIILFLADAPIPHIVLESVHMIAFYQTKMDIYLNILFKL